MAQWRVAQRGPRVVEDTAAARGGNFGWECFARAHACLMLLQLLIQDLRSEEVTALALAHELNLGKVPSADRLAFL